MADEYKYKLKVSGVKDTLENRRSIEYARIVTIAKDTNLRVVDHAEYMKMVCDRGLDRQVHILAGVIPIRSVGMARYMRDYVSGVSVPDEIISRMEGAEKAKEEGVSIILEIIEQLKEIPGVHGIHIMAVGWEDIVAEMVEKAGLMPRPVV